MGYFKERLSKWGRKNWSSLMSFLGFGKDKQKILLEQKNEREGEDNLDLREDTIVHQDAIKEDGFFAPKNPIVGEAKMEFLESLKPNFVNQNGVIDIEPINWQKWQSFPEPFKGRINGRSFEVGDFADAGNSAVMRSEIQLEGGNRFTFKINKKQAVIRESFSEHLEYDDGQIEDFKTGGVLGTERRIKQSDKRGETTLVEEAKESKAIGAYAEEAQPSNDVLTEYAKATGLPIIGMKSGRPDETGFQVLTFQEAMGTEEIPFLVERSAEHYDSTKEPADRWEIKLIRYIYPSKAAFINGEKPYMIQMRGIDGREGASGTFRLKGDSYVDNSTFRREDGEYKYDTVTYEHIMELAGPMAHLTDKTNLAVRGEYEMPDIIKTVGQKIIDKMKEKDKRTIRSPQEEQGL